MSSHPGREEQELSLPRVLAQSLGVQLNRAAQKSRDLFNRSLQPLNLTSKGFAVLSILQEGVMCSQKDLGKCLEIDRTTMVSVIDELERYHFVERTHHPADRRQHVIILTPRGKEVYQQGLLAMEHFEETYFAALSTEQRHHLILLLQRLTNGEQQ